MPPRRFAESTEVPADKTRGEIERMLARYGAMRFAYMTEPGAAIVMFEARERTIRFRIPMPDRGEFAEVSSWRGNQYSGRWETRARTPAQQEAAYDQALRVKWRQLKLYIQAQLEAIENGVVSFDDAFLAESVLPDKRTVGEWLKPQIDQLFMQGRIPPMLPKPED